MENKITKKFDRLPSDAGLTFEGVEGIPLEGRKYVKKELDEFINIIKEETKPTIRIIVGEWGMGKDDAYIRYIKPNAKNNYIPLYLSTPTLSNSFKSKEVKALMDTTLNQSLKFLVALFASIKDEQENAPITSQIPDFRAFKDADSFVRKTLSILTQNKEKKLIIYINEFEEILLQDSSLIKDTISGIKETINGQFKPIWENGEFEGCLHFVIAATPDAFYKLQTTEELSLIWGGLGRRIGKITLREIKREEGIEFLWDLLKYSFNGNLPDPPPIMSIGILNGIYRISQGNPGNIVSLFTRLMGSAKINDNYMKIIDYEHFLEFLKDKEISVYGGSTRCLEIENYNKIMSIVEDQRILKLGKDCKQVLSLLIGEHKPFKLLEIEQRLGLDRVVDKIAIINNSLNEKLNIQRAILKLAKLKEGKTIDDIKNKFSEFIRTRDATEVLEIDNFSEPFYKFIDRITFYKFSREKKLEKEIYLPIDDLSILSFFEGISEDRVPEIRNKIRKLCDTSEYYYLASEELLLQIFPTPIPLGLEYIKDREIKMKLWREITRDLVNQQRKYMPEALITILNLSELFTINVEKNVGKDVIIANIEINSLPIRALLYSIRGDIKAEDIEELHKIIKTFKPPLHLILAIYTGEFTEKAKEKLEEKEFDKSGEYILLDIKIHQTLLKKIIIAHKTYTEYLGKIDQKMLLLEAKKITEDELRIYSKINEWIEEQKKRGLIIMDLKSSKSQKALADSLKFYINFMDEIMTSETAFKKNRETLLQFIKFGSKKGFIPDIESVNELEKLSNELAENSFLEKTKNGYKVIDHPVEKRVLKVLSSKREPISSEELRNYFIIGASYQKILEDVFLNILEHKGKIRSYRSQNQRYIELVREIDIRKDLDELFIELQENLSREDIRRYGFCLVAKLRKKRTILVKEFKDFVNNEYSKIKNINNNEILLQKASLLKKLISYFLDEWVPLIEKAAREGKELVNTTKKEIKKLTDDLKYIDDKIRTLIKIETNLINSKEVRDICRLYNTLISIRYSQNYETIKTHFEKYYEENKKLYDHKHHELEYPYFNMKLLILKELTKKVREKINKNSNVTNRLKERFRGIDDKLEKIKMDIKSLTISEKYIISSQIYGFIKVSSKDIMPGLKPERLSIRSILELEDIVTKYLNPIEKNITAIEELIKILKGEIYPKEKELHESIEKRAKDIEYAEKIFDLEDSKEYIEDAKGKLNNIISNYHSQVIIKNRDPNEFLREMKSNNIVKCLNDMMEDLDDIYTTLEDYWRTYQTTAQNYIQLLRDLIKVISKKHKEIDFNSLESSIIVFETMIQPEDFILLTRKLSELENRREEIRNKFYQLIKGILSKNELTVLETIVELSKKRKWIKLETLHSKLKEKNNKLQTKEINEIIGKLKREGYLKIGIGLTL
ncbi:MAG: hypothetical protein J7L75_02155 [Thermoproteales archaeon]|nr:hypothetical protein [Thermoproteales archaeon]